MSKEKSSCGPRRKLLAAPGSLWPVCYSSLVLLTHSYLIYRRFQAYTFYKATIVQPAGLFVVICLVAILTVLLVVASFLTFGASTNKFKQVVYGILKKELTYSGRSVYNGLKVGASALPALLHIASAYLLLMTSVLFISKGRQLHMPKDGKHKNLSLDVNFLTGDNLSYYDLSAISEASSSTNLELSNLLISIAVHSYTNTEIFWQSSRLFCLTYWLQGTVALLLHALSHFGFQTLLHQMREADIFILSEGILVTLYILGNVTLIASSWCVLYFGYTSIREKTCCFLKQLGCHAGLENDWVAYLPHGLALLSILIYVGCNAPIMYDYVSAYTTYHDRILVMHLTACVLYMLLSVTIWFLFTVKQDWKFQIDEHSLKRYVIVQNFHPFPLNNERHTSEECRTDDLQHVHFATQNGELRLPELSTEDNHSNTTASSTNEATSGSANGILNNKSFMKQRRNTSEQKVKFQEATKIVIETNLDSDLETTAESGNEYSDSGVFSGSTGSTESTDSSGKHLKVEAVSKDILQCSDETPVELRKAEKQIWSFACDPARRTHDSSTRQPPSCLSAASKQYVSSEVTPYSPRVVQNSYSVVPNSADLSSPV
ncbi:protein tincar-like [Watersipora subatra]|uniref:protein tincar-like n=1 Tax=Watersipora subatra TaxID=2589382 RepID=UPI00355AE2CB